MPPVAGLQPSPTFGKPKGICTFWYTFLAQPY